ncbi:MAG: hypothetical protein ACOH1J_08180 [Microbacteriaceae bacterium]
MDVTKFLSFGDVVNVVLLEAAFPFVRDPEDNNGNRSRNSMQGRVLFANEVGLHVESHGGRCMPLFEDDSSQIETSDLDITHGTFFPWGSVISVVRVADSAEYETVWQKHRRDAEAYYTAKGAYPESSREFYGWRNSLSQADHDAAYRFPQTD